jgi:hypothetical protein
LGVDSRGVAVTAVTSFETPPKFPKVLGWTEIPAPSNLRGLKPPMVYVHAVAGAEGWDAQIRTLRAPVDIKIKSWVTPEGKHPCGKKRVFVSPVEQKEVDAVLYVTASDSELIEQGEDEHIDDLNRAFMIVMREAYDAAERIKENTYHAETKEDAKVAALIAFFNELPHKLKLEVYSDETQVNDKLLSTYFDKVNYTKVRDQQDWHTLTPKTVYDPETGQAKVTVNRERQKIGLYASKDLIKF